MSTQMLKRTDDHDFRYRLGNNTIEVGYYVEPIQYGGSARFDQTNTILLDPATKASLTLESFEQICLEWLADELATRELVGY